MSPLNREANGKPSALWMWGFVALTAAGSAIAIVSVHTATPLNHLLRGVAGALLLVGGLHQSRVVAYKRATRPLYSTFAPDSLILQRQVGWSAVILGAALIASAVVALSLSAT